MKKSRYTAEQITLPSGKPKRAPQWWRSAGRWGSPIRPSTGGRRSSRGWGVAEVRRLQVLEWWLVEIGGIVFGFELVAFGRLFPQ